MRADPHSMRYRPELDGMRAVAVLIVLIFHVAQPSRFAGFIGVDVFFALSGYLITSILLRELDGRGRIALGRFYVRRLLRLYPALLLVLVLTFPFARVLSGGFGLQAKDVVVSGTYTANLYQTYRNHWLGGLSHTWSLALEEQYYVVWPVLLMVLIRWGVRRAVLAVALIVAALGSAALHVHDFRYGGISYPVQSTSFGLLAGSALALAAPHVGGRRAPDWTAVAGVAVLVADLVAFSVTTAVPNGLFSPVAVVATLLLLIGTAQHRGGPVFAALVQPPLVWIGRVSYGVYLWHYPVLRIVSGYVDLPRAVLFVVDLALALVLAAASHRWVELPFLRLKARLDERAPTTSPRGVPESPDEDRRTPYPGTERGLAQ